MNRKTFEKIIKILQQRYKDWYFEKENPFEVLITTILSQRTKDEITEKAAERLLSVVKTPKDFLKLSTKQIERLIKPVGFYRVKAKRLKEVVRILVNKYGGKVPKTKKELLTLPGVGNKTADCVLSFAYGEQTIPVDVHVAVITKRLGITDSNDYEKIQYDLFKVTPKNKRKFVNYLLVEFGKEICRTQRPRCEICPIKRFCHFYKLLNRS